MEHCTKTGASSHESNEAAILRHKNRKLQKALRAKQQTVTELLQLVGRVTQQQGAESSAVEDVDEDDDASDAADAPSQPTIQLSAPQNRRPVRGGGGGSVAARGTAGSHGSSEAGSMHEGLAALAGKLEQLERDMDGL